MAFRGGAGGGGGGKVLNSMVKRFVEKNNGLTSSSSHSPGSTGGRGEHPALLDTSLFPFCLQ